ncbi:glycerate kinase II [compost metagenome]
MYGKLPHYVAEIARDAGAEAVLISGSFGPGSEQLLSNFSACFSIVDRPAALQECMEHAETLLYQCTRNVMRLIVRAGEKTTKAK